jgi:hypothetical protein
MMGAIPHPQPSLSTVQITAFVVFLPYALGFHNRTISVRKSCSFNP